MEFKIENLSKEEVDQILQSLSNQPYIQVFELIHKIQQQCNEQLSQEVK